jgi:hypothetical protein
MSSLWPTRRVGLVSLTRSYSFVLPSSPRASQAPVSIVPGEIALTRIGASSTASERVRVSAAPLVIATASVPTAILNAASPEKITNDPPSLIFGARCLASISGPITFVSNDSRTLSRSRSASLPRARADAVHTTWSMPSSLSASAAIEASSVRSTASTEIPGSSYRILESVSEAEGLVQEGLPRPRHRTGDPRQRAVK